MDGMSPFPTDQWIQQYPNIAMARSGGEPSANPTTAPVYQDSTQGAVDQGGPRPIRRRSRASRRTPTTILNASPTDFRALVQRFTGCNSNNEAGSASSSIGKSPKGPVNIDFTRSDVNESSPRYVYYENQVRSSSLQGEQMQSVGGLSGFQAGGYGVDNASVVYESIDESSFMPTRRDGCTGSHGYNV